MIRIVIGAACIAFAFVGFVTGSLANELTKPKVIAVQIFANWCEPCEHMEEAANQLSDRFDGSPILGIVLDVSDLSTRYHAKLLASALDLNALYQEKKGTLGVIYLIDGESKALIETLTAADDFEAMSAKVRKALASR